MGDFERRVEQTTEALVHLPRGELRRLERALRQLKPEQVRFVRDAMERGLIEGSLPVREHQLFEYVFERWWTHSLSTKVAVITRVVELAESRPWPGVTLPGLATAGATVDAGPVATLA